MAAFSTLSLDRLAGFVLDLDGVVYTGSALVAGVREFLAALRRRGRRILFLTNNSRESVAEVHERLARLGLEARPEEVLTALELLGEHIRDRHGPTRVLAIGTPVLAEILARAGHQVVSLEEYDGAAAVAVGCDVTFDYAKLTAAARAVARGAAFVACNLDMRLPIEDGTFLPGCGAIAEAIAAAAGVRPEVVGKPSPTLFVMALRRLGLRPGETAMIGDSLASDIAGGRGAGMVTIWLAPSGGVVEGAAAGSPGPDLTAHSFHELLQMLEGAGGREGPGSSG